jgi:hypothetical protein
MACRRDYWAAAMAFTSVAALIGAVAAEATGKSMEIGYMCASW